MQTHAVYSSKTENYARYRWDYAPEAIATILTTTGLAPDAVIADIGAGTGILTKHLLDHARQVFASAAMRRRTHNHRSMHSVVSLLVFDPPANGCAFSISARLLSGVCAQYDHAVSAATLKPFGRRTICEYGHRAGSQYLVRNTYRQRGRVAPAPNSALAVEIFSFFLIDILIYSVLLSLRELLSMMITASSKGEML